MVSRVTRLLREWLLSNSERLETDEAEIVCAGQEGPYEVALKGPK